MRIIDDDASAALALLNQWQSKLKTILFHIYKDGKNYHFRLNFSCSFQRHCTITDSTISFLILIHNWGSLLYDNTSNSGFPDWYPAATTSSSNN